MKKYPMIFSFRNLIAGTGFVAGVDIRGQVLLSDEGDGFWMYGVQPGGLAAGGEDRGTALCRFRDSYNSVLFDIAADAPDFANFRDQVIGFFAQINRPNAEEWSEALAEVRRTGLALDGLNRVDADARTPGLSISEIKMSQTTPAQNQIDSIEEAA